MKVCLNFVIVESMSHFSNQKVFGLWLCAWRLSFISFLANSRKARGSWSPPPVGKCEDDSVELKALLPSPTCSHCSQFSVISNYLSCNQLAMVMRKHAEHEGGSWFSFFYFCNNGCDGIMEQNLRIDFENTARARIAYWNWGGTRPLSLCYFVTQKFQCQAGSTRRHQTKN